MTMKTGVQLITEERWRQVKQEGWTREHDAEHIGGELASAGACYANLAAAQSADCELKDFSGIVNALVNVDWPFERHWFKPSEKPVGNLVKAGALIAAEIDRLQGTHAMPDSLSFFSFRAANVQRCEASFHMCDDWSPTDWATAMAGECGEACNLIKKLRRGEDIPVEQIGKELADLVTYADLLAHRLGINLGEAVRQKFNEVSKRVNSDVTL